MIGRATVGMLALVLLAASTGWGQQDITVQLPTFNVNTVQTTMTVPDGGTGFLGGINRAAEASTTRGVPLLSKLPYANRLFKNRGIGREVESTNFTIIPRIIDLEEEELRQTGVSAETLSQFHQDQSPRFPGLSRTAAPVSAEELAIARKAQFLAQNVGRPDVPAVTVAAEPAMPSVEEIRRQNELAKAEKSAEAVKFFAEGQRAEAEGKRSVAKIYYQMAARRATGELLDRVAARLLALEGVRQGPQLAAGR